MKGSSNNLVVVAEATVAVGGVAVAVSTVSVAVGGVAVVSTVVSGLSISSGLGLGVSRPV